MAKPEKPPPKRITMNRTIQFHTAHAALNKPSGNLEHPVKNPELAEILNEILLGLGYNPRHQSNDAEIELHNFQIPGHTLRIKARRILDKTLTGHPTVEQEVILKSVTSGHNWVQSWLNRKARARILKRFEEQLKTWIWREFSPIAFLQPSGAHTPSVDTNTEESPYELPDPA
jgi:hypothetical protein